MSKFSQDAVSRRAFEAGIDAPHGPVGEQKMRHFYGASGYVARGGNVSRDDHVAWLRYHDGRIVLCDSDAEGAFPVYRDSRETIINTKPVDM